ncbi:unnamed protein product [Acanthoscelides obtectus]|uniref:Uncharacterized protein n=1 Tax=Acanthoscelides obtectus TaxID=200917 RepID=A0A9P0JYS8_ACAOB|nr:unnamed protein product [Acanthoscelides obtectus]CAK1633810.1 hypothetical protein AOBTE_LOCUS8406 [Acanthoscelides obtectus]
MSADSFHQKVEKCMKQKQEVSEFNDFSDAVRMAGGKNGFVKDMQHAAFYNWIDPHSVQKVKSQVHLSDIVQIVAERGKLTLKYKRSYEQDFEQLDFLKKSSKKIVTVQPEAIKQPAGIDSLTRDTIIKKLGPLMAQNRLNFWKNVPIE